MEAISAFMDEFGELLALGCWESFLMTALSCMFAYVIGLPLGTWFHMTKDNGLAPNKAVNTVLGWVINIGRSIPFIILLVAIIPFTRLVVGTSLGVQGAIVPLTISAAPFVARMVEQSLADIDGGLVEAGQSFGANTWQLVTKVYLKESLPSLIRGAAITFITLFGYAAMAGCVGAGGLGDIAIRYGYQRYKVDVMIVSVVLCVILVQVIQSVGDVIARKTDKRTR